MNGPWWLPEKLDALYGAIAGGLIALLSSLFTHRHSLKRQKFELTHQAEQKERERHYALKRDIYLPLLEAANAAVTFVVQVPTLPVERLGSDNPVGELGKHIAKLNLVASPEVIEPVMRAQSHLTKCFIALTSERLEIQKLAAELTSIGAQMEFLSNQQRRIFERLERHLDQGTGEPNLRRMLAQNLDNLHNQSNALLSRQHVVLKSKQQLELSLLRRANKDLKPLRKHSAVALFAIRKDLGLPIDEKWFSELLETTARDIDDALEGFQSEIERKSKDLVPGSTATPSESAGNSADK